jgi:hypothetical protein
MQVDLNLLPYQSDLRLSVNRSTTYVWDPIRRKNIVVLPEEMVRQLLVRYLLTELAYPKNRLRVEVGIRVNGMQRRCDVVVYDTAVRPWMLIEVKSPKVPVNDRVFEQAVAYNMQMKVAFLVVTNGIITFCAELDYGMHEYKYCSVFPTYPES